ncbi:pyridoxamine 5'-phosphate oxidase family protein [Prescottella subtropica]|uniref:pyridoxamine 5'-phosphate oxidase family protein n=1 Tax=Prescottella subtropica TaxID=2545757 RepID=UPI0010F5F853|nr:pyridoxamine 5'-phosphate oxidase family protein [Prescottella subtropica]
MDDCDRTEVRARRFHDRQWTGELNAAMIAFVERRDLMFIGTSARDGTCDVSLRAGPRGFVRVLSPTLLGFPDYRGNGVMASLGNLRENPHIGLFLVDFTDDVIGLHINGTATVVDPDDWHSRRPGIVADRVRPRVPQWWVQVCVEEAYIHCRKNIPHLVTAPAVSAGADPGGRPPDGRDFFGVAAGRREVPGSGPG